MRTYLLAAAAIALAAGGGCRNINLADRHCDTCGPRGHAGHGGILAGHHGGHGSGLAHGGYAGGPGGHLPGGHYGPHGGAYGTPGFPHHHFDREYVGPQGPPTAQVAYPYYTTRGPRDFLLDNPPSIGR